MTQKDEKRSWRVLRENQWCSIGFISQRALLCIMEKPNSVDKIRVHRRLVSRGAGIPQHELEVQPRFQAKLV